MKILIVDDSTDKIAGIVSAIHSLPGQFTIDTVADIVSAQRKLIAESYDLLVTDLVLPYRNDEEKDPKGGYNLLTEISRNDKLMSPRYIIGLTQFEEHLDKFSLIWRVVHFTPASNVWRDILQSLILHIRKAIGQKTPIPEVIKPTIFVEGKFDERIIGSAIKCFAPGLDNLLTIKTDKSAGASWVARQIIVWAYSLKETNGEYYKAIGIVDGDKAGHEASAEITRKIDKDSAQSKTFKIVKLSLSHARHLISLLKKGVNIPIGVEEMIPPKYWKHAEQQNWFEKRQDPESFLEDPKQWNKYDHSIKTHLDSLGLTQDELLYLNKIKLTYKEEFWKYILELPDDERKIALECFKPLLSDICNYFGISLG